MNKDIKAGLIAAILLYTQSLLAANNAGLDINDASVLFPNNGKHLPVPLLTLDQTSIIDPNIFKAVQTKAKEIGISAPSTAAFDRPTDWSVRAFRVDPCAPEEHGKSLEPCLYELRLIAQPTARFSAADSGLHLIYKIAAGKPNADDKLLEDLLALKRESETLSSQSTNGEALGVHPILQKAVKDKRQDIPALFATFVKTHAKAAKLSKVTMMGLRSGSPTDWIFFGGDIIDGRWTMTPVPNLKARATHFVELNTQDETKPFKGLSIESSLALDNFFNATVESNNTRIDTLAQTAFALENPALSHRNNSDCISCHTATSVRLSTDYSFPEIVDGTTAMIPKGITAFPALGTVQNHPLHWNLRAFGYFGLQPTVSMRTVNEAAQAVAEINTILGLTPPAKDCSQKQTEINSCLIKGTLEIGTVESTADCLKLCE